jgi:integrase
VLPAGSVTCADAFPRGCWEGGEDKLPELQLHGIRHTVVTLLIESGLDVAKVAKRVGHSSPAITLAIYTHGTLKGDELAAAVLDFG